MGGFFLDEGVRISHVVASGFSELPSDNTVRFNCGLHPYIQDIIHI